MSGCNCTGRCECAARYAMRDAQAAQRDARFAPMPKDFQDGSILPSENGRLIGELWPGPKYTGLDVTLDVLVEALKSRRAVLDKRIAQASADATELATIEAMLAQVSP